jgi:hypothetical protein
MYNGVMGIDEAHPSILHPHVDNTAVSSFLELGATERLKLAEDRMDGVKNGRWKSCKTDGGKLECHHGGERKAEQTRQKKAETGKPEGSGKKRGRGDCSPGSPDLDREIKRRPSEKPVGCGKQVDDHDDDEDHVPIKPECFDKPGWDINKTVLHRPITDYVDKQLSPLLEQMDVDPPTPGAKTQLGEEAAEHKKPPTLIETALALAKDIIEQARRLLQPAKKCNIDLTEYISALALAESVEDVIRLGREVAEKVRMYRVKLSQEFLAQEKILNDAEAKKQPEGILVKHREMVVEHKKYEHEMSDLRGVESSDRGPRLQARLGAICSELAVFLGTRGEWTRSFVGTESLDGMLRTSSVLEVRGKLTMILAMLLSMGMKFPRLRSMKRVRICWTALRFSGPAVLLMKQP